MMSYNISGANYSNIRGIKLANQESSQIFADLI